MPLSRNNILVIAAIMGILALTLIGAGVFGGRLKPGYMRINVSDKSVVCVQFDGAELRAAMSVEGLKIAAPVAMRAFGRGAAQSPEFTLPVPSGQLPEGIAVVKARFTRSGNNLSGQLGICRLDEQKAEWQCDVFVPCSLGDTAESAPAVAWPRIEKMALSVTPVPSRGNLGIGAGIVAGGNAVAGLRRNGKPVQVSVSVADSAGATAAQKTGPLTDFGFS